MKGKKLSTDIEALKDVLESLGRLNDDDEKLWVLATAASRLKLAPPIPAGNVQTTTASSDGASIKLAPKEFMRSKGPKNDVQRVACLAFYLTYARSTPHFRIVDLENLNTEAAGPNTNMTRASDNATRKSCYLAAGEGRNKQITILGEDIVKALPDQDAVKALEKKMPRKRRRKQTKSGKTAKK